MKYFTLVAFIFLIFNCTINLSNESTDTTISDETISNDVATLGLVGVSVSSSKSNVANAEITSFGKIKITSVSEGMTIITVSNILGYNAYINVCVSETRSIKIGTIVKYSDDAEIRISRFDLENDMFLLHEGFPSGVPDYGWKYWPRVVWGNNIPDGWNSILAWGQVYADQSLPNPDKDFPLVRVQIKDIQLYIYIKMMVPGKLFRMK